ncbi:MAG: phosphotransferase [Desulfamplus sp.]|nr:phosphotransferase [Desulfamplus sp.]
MKNRLNTMLKILRKHYAEYGTWEVNDLPVGNTLKVNNDKNKYLIKKHMNLIWPNRKKLETLYSDCCKADIVPPILPSDSGQLLLETPEGIFSLQKMISGRAPMPRDMNLLSHAIPKLHAILAASSVKKLQNHLNFTVKDIRKSAEQYGYCQYLKILEEALDIFSTEPRQIIHGDLHKGNLLIANNRVIFLDLDSATESNIFQDIIFLGYRINSHNKIKINQFINSFHLIPHTKSYSLKFYFPLLIYTILQRILFIFIRRDMGEDQWMNDLDNQKNFLLNANKLRH